MTIKSTGNLYMSTSMLKRFLVAKKFSQFGPQNVFFSQNGGLNTRCSYRATENVGVENAIRAKMQGWKMQEWKMMGVDSRGAKHAGVENREQIAGVKNAGVG